MDKDLEEKAYLLEKLFGLTEYEAKQFVRLILKLDLTQVKTRELDQVQDFFDILPLLKQLLMKK